MRLSGFTVNKINGEKCKNFILRILEIFNNLFLR